MFIEPLEVHKLTNKYGGYEYEMGGGSGYSNLSGIQLLLKHQQHDDRR